MKMLYAEHAIERMRQRKIPVKAISQIAQIGVTVQRNGDRAMKRGEWRGKPVHVVVAQPNIVITVYLADEWESTIDVSRCPKRIGA